MKFISEFVKSCLVLAVGLFLITAGMALAQATFSSAFTEDHRKVIEVGFGFCLSALWIWCYLYYLIRPGRDGAPISLSGIEESQSRLQLIDRELRQASARVSQSFRVAMICILVGAIACCGMLLLAFFRETNLSESGYELAYGALVTLVGTTLMAYYTKAAKSLKELLTRAERIASLEQARREIDRSPDSPEMREKRDMVINYLLSLAMTPPGKGPVVRQPNNETTG